jgi:hypothetical protein
MAKVVTQFDVDLAMWQAKIAQIKADQREMVANAKAAKLGENMVGGGVASKAMEGIKNNIVAITGAAAGLMGIKGIIDEFDRFGDIAASLDTTAESFQRVNRIVKLNGTDAEAAFKGLIKVKRALSEQDNPALTKAFDDLGISSQRFLAMAPEQQLVELATAFQAAQEKGTGFNAIYSIFSKTASELLPTLRTSREELEKISQAPVVNERTIQNIQDFNDGFDNLTMSAKGLTAALLGGGLKDTFASLVSGDPAGYLAKRREENAQFLAGKQKEQAARREAAQAAAVEATAQNALGARMKASTDEGNKLAALKTELANTQMEIGFKNLPPVGQLIAITRQMAAMKQEAMSQGPMQGSDQMKLQIELNKLQAKGGDIKKGIEDQERKTAAAREEFQIQQQIDAAKVASGGEDNAQIQRLEDQLAAKKLMLMYETQYHMTAQQALAVSNQQVASARAVTNAQQAKQRATSAGDMKEDMKVEHLRAHHHDRQADALERQVKTKRMSRDLQKDLGLDPAAADKIAEQRAKDEDRRNGRHHIRGGVSKSADGLSDFYKHNPQLAPGKNAAAQLGHKNAQNAAHATKNTVSVDGFQQAVSKLDEIVNAITALGDDS